MDFNDKYKICLQENRQNFIVPIKIIILMEEKTTKNYNVLLLSIAFMLIFTGFNTMAGVQVS